MSDHASSAADTDGDGVTDLVEQAVEEAVARTFGAGPDVSAFQAHTAVDVPSEALADFVAPLPFDATAISGDGD